MSDRTIENVNPGDPLLADQWNLLASEVNRPTRPSPAVPYFEQLELWEATEDA